MKRISSFIIFTIATGSLFTACRKADEIQRNPANVLTDIYASKDGNGRDRLFNPRYSNDTIYFDIPYFFPEYSDDETDLTKIFLRGSIPSDAYITPAFGVFTDLSKPYTFSVVSGTGEVKKYVVMSKKVGNVSLANVKVKFTDGAGATQEIDGVLQPSGEVLFYLLPGTAMNNAKITYEINKHSTASIAIDGAVDLSQPLPFVITGTDGVSKTYTLKVAEPIKLAYGIGINRQLWVKSGSDLGFTANNEVGIAVSGDHLILVRRTNPSKFSVYNRFTAAYVQEMYNPFGAQLSFQMVEDTVGNLLAASWAPKNAKFMLYKYKNALDGAPVKLIDWTNNNPATIPLDGGVGRRVNIYGNLDGNAVIMAPAGQSNVIFRWRVQNGVVVSQTPETIVYPGLANGAANFGFYAEAQPVSAGANADYFINYQQDIAFVNGATNARSVAFANEVGNFGIFHMPTAYTRFNNANYLAIVKYVSTYDLNRIHTCLFDVTNTSRLNTSSTDPNYSTFNVFTSAEQNGTLNGNGTADICVAFSQNKERMQVYTLLTNGGIVAHEFTTYAK
ncbi:DUF5018 domain-containing protein [Chitinophaga sp. SYP-B3965]|uniref:DUF5018 domain-containing protein n=1 Tax=Chitinophaga sp. SYP-B3965 TaxID=2663120 RepID=UPI001299CAD0|nr:DUF5018 domain-containing protein [Chitinophaga sp. SYP-B3965]MRG46103.1 DUF5018 domain-containing protein [Chitinophaga sp. SYP-B3965]